MQNAISNDAKPGFWARLVHALEGLGKTEQDHVWDGLNHIRNDVADLQTRISSLEQATNPDSDSSVQPSHAERQA